MGSLASLAAVATAMGFLFGPSELSAGPPACDGHTTRNVLFVGETGRDLQVRPEANTGLPAVQRLPRGCLVGFVGYCLGDTIADAFHGIPDMRWFVLPNNAGLIASAVIKGNPPPGTRQMSCPGSRPAPPTLAVAAVPGSAASTDLRLSANALNSPIVGFAAAQVVAGSPGNWSQIGWDPQPNDGFSIDWHTSAFLDDRQFDRMEVLVAAVSCVARDWPSGAPVFLAVSLDRNSPPMVSNTTSPIA